MLTGQSRGVFDIISWILVYFTVLVFIWGYSMSWYLNEIGVPNIYDLQEGESYVNYLVQLPTPSEAWNPINLFEVGQSFKYKIKTSKDIDLVYDIVDESPNRFDIDSYAQVKTTASIKTTSLMMQLNIRDLMIADSFSIDKTSGLPLTTEYTTSFWNMQGCEQTRFYFLKTPLEAGTTWEIPKSGITINISNGNVISNFWSYKCTVHKPDVTNSTFWISKEIPLILGYHGTNCLRSDNVYFELSTFTSHQGRTYGFSFPEIVETINRLDENRTRDLKWHPT